MFKKKRRRRRSKVSHSIHSVECLNSRLGMGRFLTSLFRNQHIFSIFWKSSRERNKTISPLPPAVFGYSNREAQRRKWTLSLSLLSVVSCASGLANSWPIVQADDSNFSFDKLLSLTSRKRSDGQQQLSCVIPFLRDSWRRVRTLTNHPFKWRPNWAEGGERKTEN